VVVRQNALPFVPWFLLFLAVVPERGGDIASPAGWPSWASFRARLIRTLLPFAAGFGALFLPNAVRTARYFGHPFHGLGWQSTWLCYTGAVPLDKASQIWGTTGLSVDPLEYLATHPGELFAKMEYQIRDALTRLKTGGTPGAASDAVFMALVLLGLLAPPKEERWLAATRWLFAICGLTALLVGGAAFLRWRHLYLFLPTALVYAAEVARRLFALPGRTESAGLRHLRVAALLIAVATTQWLPLVPEELDLAGEYDRRLRALGTFVAQNTPENAIVLVHTRPSGVSLQGLAWHARRQCVSYSEFTLKSLEASRGPRPLYALCAALSPRGPRPLEGLGPGRGAGFARVVRFDDRLRGVAARLLIRE
jgi:hypothetical protein